MGIFFHALLRIGNADQDEHFDGAFLGGLPVEVLMQAQRFADLTADVEHRVEARHRLLENHADVVAADVAHLAIGEFEQFGSLEADRSGDLAGRFRDQAEDRIRGDRLAAAALADNRQRFTLLHVKGHAIHRTIDSHRGAEMGLQVFDFEQRHRVRFSSLEHDPEKCVAVFR